MSETNKLILELIREKKNLKDIADIMGLSIKQTYQRIRQIQNFGYQMYFRYHSDGTLEFNPKYSLLTPEERQSFKNIYTYNDEQDFTALVVSDLHIGNSKERLDLIKRLYEFCSQKNIHIILNAGDFIDGLFGRTPRIHDDYLEQLYYLVNKFPYDENILNFVLLGNHDISILDQQNLDLARFIENQRHDIIPLGYANGEIRVKNDSIGLVHSISGSPNSKRVNLTNNSPILFYGHSHKMKIESQNGQVKCTVPSLSDLLFSEHELPSAVLVKTSFNKGLFDYVTLKQLILDDKHIRIINESKLRVRSKGDIVQIYGNLTDEKRNRLILKKTRE